MRVSHTLRYAGAAIALAAVGMLINTQFASEAEGQTNLIQDGKIGFVLHQFGGAGTAGEQVCPDGRSVGYRQQFEQSPEGQRREGETDDEYGARLQRGGMAMATRDGINSCQNPEAAGPDPLYRTMDDTRAMAYGIDLDDANTTANGRPPPGACAQNDFRRPDGVRGIDNQYARLTNCTGQPSQYPADWSGWLPPNQQGQGQENTMLEGSWGVLIELTDVDNLENDPDVGVAIYANNDPIQLNAARDAAIRDVTYAPKQEPRYRGITRGRIVNGVLRSDPVDIAFPFTAAGGLRDRIINRAVVEARFTTNGEIEGYLGGWWPIEDLYSFQYAFGGSPLAVAVATTMGRTCNGPYHAAYALADGDYDPETGRCTSISTQYAIRGTPAFIVDVATSSANDDLENGPGAQRRP